MLLTHSLVPLHVIFWCHAFQLVHTSAVMLLAEYDLLGLIGDRG